MVSQKLILLTNGNTVLLYDGMYDFIIDEKADLGNYELTEEIADLPFVEEVYPVNAGMIKVYEENKIELEGYVYVMVSLEREDGIYTTDRYLLEEAIPESVYIIYSDRVNGRYKTNGKVYCCYDEAVDDVKIDINKCSDADFENIMLELMAQESYEGLLRITGVYAPLREHFNNMVLEIWRERKHERLYERR